MVAIHGRAAPAATRAVGRCGTPESVRCDRYSPAMVSIWRPIALTGLVLGLLIAALLANRTPEALPAVALGDPLMLQLERSFLLFAAGVFVLVVLARAASRGRPPPDVMKSVRRRAEDGLPQTRAELRAYLAESRRQHEAARERTLAAIARVDALRVRR
jgi:membrane protein implicated in regulation of membrane protease activity